MDTAAMAGEILNREARKATMAVGLTCKIGTEKTRGVFDALMGEFWFRILDPTTTIHPDYIERHAVGIMQFTLYAREAQDQQRAIVVANNLKEWMEKQVWKVDEQCTLVTEPMKVSVMNSFKIGRGVTILDGGFDVWMREPPHDSAFCH